MQPVPLAFLGQIYLREIHKTLPLLGWPREGSLAFFYDPAQPWGFDPTERGSSKILYLSDSEDLRPIPCPPNLKSHFSSPSRSLQFSCEWILPSKPEDHGCQSVDSTSEAYSDLLENLIDNGCSRPIHRLSGYPQEVQGQMELECQLVTHGIYCGGPEGYRDPRRAELEKGVSDWRLVMQFDSEEGSLGWMWGDLGRVYFWIRKQDLERGKFENAWSIVQCG